MLAKDCAASPLSVPSLGRKKSRFSGPQCARRVVANQGAPSMPSAAGIRRGSCSEARELGKYRGEYYNCNAEAFKLLPKISKIG